MQMPLFQLCKETGQLQLEAMSALYLSELKIASAAALGKLDAAPGQGDHVPPSCVPPPLSPYERSFSQSLAIVRARRHEPAG
jgi:hypothetical protein